MSNKFSTAMDSVVEMNPKIKKARSTFNLGIKEYTTFNVGELVPIGGFTEVLPGDTFNINLDIFLRMTSPSIRPPMDNLYMDVYAFFVPNRFVDKGWIEIQGESSSAWTVPSTTCSVLEIPDDNSIVPGSLLNHLGIPNLTTDGKLTLNIYPVYSYWKIWNDWFRDQNVQSEIAYDNSNNTYVLSSLPTINGVTILNAGSLCKVAKYHDIFTSALPAPQKGPAVPILNINTAPINVKLFSGSGDASGTAAFVHNLTATSSANPISQLFAGNTNNSYDIYTDLSSAGSINQLRLAFQLQKAYELDARGGTRYTEAVENRFGVNNPDLRLGRSELLGHYRFPLNMTEIATTSGAIATNSTDNLDGSAAYNQGVGSGSSKTGNSQHICVKSFTEHGLVMIVGCIRPDLTYQCGIEKYWSKTGRYDFYEPVFANIGEVPIMKSELFGPLLCANNTDTVFGYQEAWYDYRYKQNHVSGMLSSWASTNFDIFHYAMDFNAAPTLSSTFIEQSAAAIDRTLMVTSAKADQFMLNASGVIKATRVMPLFSVPGLVDHF